MQNKRWYQRTGGIILFLIIFFPVGLYLMWKHGGWSNLTKWIVTGVVALVAIGTAFDDSETTTATAPAESANQPQEEQAAAAPEPEPEPAPEPAPEPEPEPAAEPEPAPEPEQPDSVPIGTPVKAGDLEWNVTNGRYATELVSQFGEFGNSKTGNFVIVDFVVLNDGTEATTIASQSLALLDGEGRRSETDPDAFEYVDPAKNVFLEQVNPGVTAEGEVIFSVAPDAEEFILEVGDASFFGGETAQVNLGF